MTPKFRAELARLINLEGIDAKVGAPDFLLADFLADVLNDLQEMQRRFRNWRNTPKPE